MMDDVTFAQGMVRELELETRATRKCVELFRPDLFDYKPHERSMNMGYLTLLCAEIPMWIKHIIHDPFIDFTMFRHIQASTARELVAHFDNNVAEAKAALMSVTNGSLDARFELRNDGVVLFSSTKRESIETTINHMVHHRGQLTVYMRLNEIPVPSIYGPSADDRNYQ